MYEIEVGMRTLRKKIIKESIRAQECRFRIQPSFIPIFFPLFPGHYLCFPRALSHLKGCYRNWAMLCQKLTYTFKTQLMTGYLIEFISHWILSEFSILLTTNFLCQEHNCLKIGVLICHLRSCIWSLPCLCILISSLVREHKSAIVKQAQFSYCWGVLSLIVPPNPILSRD